MDICDSHRVEIRYSVAEGDSPEHVRGFDERVEEVKGGYKSIGRDFNGGDIGGFDADRLGELGKVGEKFVLRYFAASSLHLGEVGHDEVGR